MADPQFPFALKAVAASHSLAHVRNAIASLGTEGSPALIDAGVVPADVLFPQTLILLAGQPRGEGGQPSGEETQGSNTAVAGGVWVREQLTVHRPIGIGESFTVCGEIARSFARKGRLYRVSTSRTLDEAGAIRVSSRTTGLVRYRADPTLVDFEQGRPESELDLLGPDPECAASNPAAAALRSARVGDSFAGPDIEVTLASMRERDGGRSANPIHTEPEEARRAGLSAPIAGGPQVFGYAQALLTRAFDPQVLLYGAHLDVHWRAPVHAGQTVRAAGRVVAVADERIEFALEVILGDVIAMVAAVEVPLFDERTS